MNKYQKNLTTKTRKVLRLIDDQNKAQYKLDDTRKPQIKLDFRQARKTVKILKPTPVMKIMLEWNDEIDCQYPGLNLPPVMFDTEVHPDAKKYQQELFGMFRVDWGEDDE